MLTVRAADALEYAGAVLEREVGEEMAVARNRLETDRLPEHAETIPRFFHAFLPVLIAGADEHRDVDVLQSVEAAKVGVLDREAGERRQWR